MLTEVTSESRPPCLGIRRSSLKREEEKKMEDRQFLQYLSDIAQALERQWEVNVKFQTALNALIKTLGEVNPGFEESFDRHVEAESDQVDEADDLALQRIRHIILKIKSELRRY